LSIFTNKISLAGHYARDLGLTSVEEMIPHLTSRPAKRMGIYPKRGYVGEGGFADLVLFDPARISDTATYEKPREKCKGIEMVLVNGRVVYEHGEVTGVRAGQVLRRRHGKVG
jgi:N-acyl-D-amino-acid deacylase